jgi:hypothetical protein
MAGGAHALTPNESMPASEAAKNAPAAPAKTAAEPAQTDSSATASPTVLVTAQQDKKWRSKGYKPVVRHGETLYCRREPTLGTHFEANICRTPADLEIAERSAQYYLEQNQRIGAPSKCPNCKFN